MKRCETTPLKYLAAINERSLSEDTDPERPIRYVDISTVGMGTLVSQPETMHFADAPSRARRLVRPGDTIVSTVRTYLRAVWPVEGDTSDLVVSTGFAVLSPRTIDPRYFSWWIRSDNFIEEVVARSVGVSYPAINALDLGELAVRVPAPSEQREIADHLDAETARIDAVIAKKRRMLELLHERWRSYVDAVTAIGELRRVRHVTSLRTSGPRGWADRVGDRGRPFLRSANLSRDSIQLQLHDLDRVEPADSPEARRSMTEAGDTLVGITGANTGWVGAVGEAAVGGFVSQHVSILRPDSIEPHWLTYSIFAPRAQDQLLGGQYGGTKTQLGLEDLAELTIRVPPVGTQHALLNRLEVERRRRTELTSCMASQIELLIEHRQALITAAVTGDLGASKAA